MHEPREFEKRWRAPPCAPLRRPVSTCYRGAFSDSDANCCNDSSVKFGNASTFKDPNESQTTGRLLKRSSRGSMPCGRVNGVLPLVFVFSSFPFFRTYYHVGGRGNKNDRHFGKIPYGPTVGLMAQRRYCKKATTPRSSLSKIIAAGGKILRPSSQRLHGHRRGTDFHGEDGGNLMFLVSRLRHARSWKMLELAVESPRFDSMTSAHQLWVRLPVGITSAMITSLISWCTWTSIKAWKHFRVSGGSRRLGGWLPDFTRRL